MIFFNKSSKVKTKTNNNKIVQIIQLKRIGDFLLTFPILYYLTEKFNFKVRLISNKNYIQLYNLLPPNIKKNVEFVPYKTKGINFRLLLKAFITKSDYIIDITANLRSYILIICSKSSKKIGLEKTFFRFYFSKFFYNNFSKMNERDVHTINYFTSTFKYIDGDKTTDNNKSHFNILKKILLSQNSKSFFLNISSELQNNVLSTLSTESEINLENGFVIIHPGSARIEKFWLAKNWAAVINYINDKFKIPCLITGTENTLERNHSCNIMKLLTKKKININCVGKFNLTQHCALVKKANLIISVDTSIIHISSLLKKPQISLFGLTNPYHWHPFNEKSIIIQAGHSLPIQKFTKFHKKQPMYKIKSKTVCLTIDDLL